MNDILISKFDKLLKKWEEETLYLSDTNLICMNINHQMIIGMGKEALPLIYNDILKNKERVGRRWLWALRSITGLNPLEDKNELSTKEKVSIWIEILKKDLIFF